jgi:hypothetical protein
MRVRVDEAGSFDFRKHERFAVGAIAAVVIPDTRWSAVKTFVKEKQQLWDMPRELKACNMKELELGEMAEFFQTQGLPVVGVVTDSKIFSIDAQKRWRSLQVEKFKEAAARSTRAIDDPLVRDRVARLHTRLPSERHVKSPNFLQYFILMPWLLSRALSTGLLAYRDLPSDADSWIFDVAVDPRDGADPGKPGELLRDSLDAILASDDGTALLMPAEWPVDHPFKVRNADPEVGAVSSRQIFARGICTPDSHTDAGLQLADFVAHVIYSVVRDEDDEAKVLWEKLQPQALPTNDGRPLMIWGAPDEGASAEDEGRYERLFGAIDR